VNWGKTMKNVLLVNPWIYDFAAYDLWLKPWGLLKISTILKKNGFNVYFVDAMDRRHVLINKKNKDFFDGTGKFPFKEIKKPKIIENVPRKYKRYGLGTESFKRALPDTNIDIILVSSGMTYWYLGAPGESLEDVKDSIEFVNSLGGKVSLSEFSPIPGTPAAEKFVEVLKEPLLQNNSIFPLFDQAKWKDIRFLKNYAHELNSSLF